ncbi:MAG: MmcQ/YjbR family DNA-binding protein, partial [Bosea sp. (in: a-proteobacteria)]|nr:MmcQ/YjbR family DNA-binding protein [Bosea sp. (in: a-proteobacteria)]
MSPAAYNAFCAALPATSHVVQWGGADVWKVGEKVFAIARAQEDGEMAVSFKCSRMAFD